LTVAKITQGAAGGYAEYLDGKTRAAELGDYYLKDGERVEAPGRWAAGARTFGLDEAAPVAGEQLRILMAVQRPDGGGQLRRTGGSGEAVAAIDTTFSAPKSVSAAWAVSDRAVRLKIEQAHETAVDRALSYATRQVPMLRRRVDTTKVVHEKATGLVATSWRHTTARAVADQVPDPQLHSHVLLHAAVRRDGRLVAIDSRSWLVHQREVGAANSKRSVSVLSVVRVALAGISRSTGSHRDCLTAGQVAATRSRQSSANASLIRSKRLRHASPRAGIRQPRRLSSWSCFAVTGSCHRRRSDGRPWSHATPNHRSAWMTLTRSGFVRRCAKA
jgi:conjugative relaxase-like TrwC/TraI family protein